MTDVFYRNAAVITDDFTTALCLQWHGGRDSVETFLKFCELKHYASFTRLVQVVTNFIGTDIGRGVEVRPYERCEHDADDDNGVYLVDSLLWRINQRLNFHGREQQGHDRLELLGAIDRAQGPSGRLIADPAHMLDGSAHWFVMDTGVELFDAYGRSLCAPSKLEEPYQVVYPAWIRADNPCLAQALFDSYRQVCDHAQIRSKRRRAAQLRRQRTCRPAS